MQPPRMFRPHQLMWLIALGATGCSILSGLTDFEIEQDPGGGGNAMGGGPAGGTGTTQGGGAQGGSAGGGGGTAEQSCISDVHGERLHTCAVLKDGTLHCWGDNANRQVTAAQVNTVTTPTVVRGIGPVTAVAPGRRMTIALAQDRRVWAWGKNDMGELGLGDAIDRDEPTVIPGLTNVSAIAAGKDFACALIVNEVWCWGNNGHGQVTDPPSNAAWTPTRVFSGATKLALGPEHTCILGTDEHVWCWGREEDGRLGDGIPNTKQQRSTSVGDLAKVSAGGRTTCAVGNNGVVYCWGDNRYGGLGLDVVLSTLVPTQVPGIPAAIDVVVSAKRACARTTDGNVWCWGESDNTPVSNGNPENPQKPSLAADLTGSDQVELSPYTTCAVFGDLLRCRGGNSLGQLGNGTTTPSTTLVDVVLPCPPAL